MRSIAETVAEGIRSEGELHEALRTAMRIEFATIPPYLCAEWSVDERDDPDGVADMIGDIAKQEMSHFALVGNLLSAIGGAHTFDAMDLLLLYPAKQLPGGIDQEFEVGLRPLSYCQLAIFMQIERPAFPPVRALTTGPATIGEFYGLLEKALVENAPGFDASRPAIVYGEATSIGSLDDARRAIQLIRAEGEGTAGDPEQPGSGALAHYYVFRSLLRERVFERKADGSWGDGAGRIRMPGVLSFEKAEAPSAALDEFARTLTQLLKALQLTWQGTPQPWKTPMRQLGSKGRALIRSRLAPEFRWMP